MKQLDIVIATRNRFEKLIKTLDSIPVLVGTCIVNVHICCDYDKGTYDKLKELKKNGKYEFIHRLHITLRNMGSVYCRNLLLQEINNNVIVATDDIIFDDDAIEIAIRDMERFYPDNNGVIGFNQTGNKKFHPTGITMVGINFLKRYPKKHLFNPAYFHFAAQEIYWLSNKLGLFIESDATVHHLNPNINREYLDQTHTDARKHFKKDHDLMKYRLENNLIWGEKK